MALQYNPTNCISCQQCKDACPLDCISFNPLFIDSTQYIGCEACLNQCPEGESVLASSDTLLSGYVVFSGEITPSQNPQNPSGQDSSQESNKGESSKDDSSQKGEGNADSSQDKDNSNQSQDKDNTDQNKQDSLLPPPPTQIQSCIKVLHEIQTLQNYLSTIK